METLSQMGLIANLKSSPFFIDSRRFGLGLGPRVSMLIPRLAGKRRALGDPALNGTHQRTSQVRRAAAKGPPARDHWLAGYKRGAVVEDDEYRSGLERTSIRFESF